MSFLDASHAYPIPATTRSDEASANHPHITVLASSRAVIKGRLTAATIVISLNTGKVTSIFHSVLPASDFPSGTPYLDHSPLILLPGLVDAHVHLNEPGRTEWEGFWTGTRAAAFGGVTTVVDMPLNAIPPTTTLKGLEEKVDAAQGQCWVDVGFYGGIVPGNASELKGLVRAGVRGFKGFLIDSGVEEFPAVSSTDIAIAMTELADEPTTLMFHAEMIPPISGSVGDDVQRSLPPLAPIGPLNEYNTFLASRPTSFETYAISEILSLASYAPELPLHIVHLSAIEAIPLLREARAHGVKITAETCFHYLSLAAEEIKNGDTRHKCCPPIRTQSNQNSLWQELLRKEDSVISTVVSDHSPCTPNLKLLPPEIANTDQDEDKDNGDFFAAWGGVSSVGLGLSILWTEGCKRGTTVEDVVRWCCMNTARQVGLERHKGDLRVGFDGDVTVFDDEATFEVGTEAMLFRNKCSPYQGKVLTGVVKETWLRGEKIYDKVTGFGKGSCPTGKLLLEPSEPKKHRTSETGVEVDALGTAFREGLTVLVVSVRNLLKFSYPDAAHFYHATFTRLWNLAAMMGQASSQIAPSTVQLPTPHSSAVPVDTPPKKRKHKKKGRAEPIVGDQNEEESARALMRMRDEAVNHVRRPSAEYHLAASSQLMNESYHSHPPTTNLEATSKKRKRDDEKDENRRKKRNHPDDNQQDKNFTPQLEEPPPDPMEGPKVVDDLDELFEDNEATSEPPDPPQSSHKLDDIQSDDGDVASLLQEYEGHDVSSYPFNGSHRRSEDECADSFTQAQPTSSPPPSCPHAAAKSEGKRKKKRKRHSAPSSDIYAEEGQMSPGVTGQHSFDIDFEAFDAFCAANGVGPANLFDDLPGQAVPIDPSLMKGYEKPAKAADNLAADSDDHPTPSGAAPGKSRRASSRSRRHKHNCSETTVLAVSNNLFFSSFDLLNEHQQDQVLPGFEDVQRQSSQEYQPSRASTTDHSGRSPSGDTNASESAPTSLRKGASISKDKTLQGRQTSHVSSPAEEGAPKVGPYSSAEIAKLEKYRDAYCEEHDISTWQFNELVQSLMKHNDKAVAMWQGIHETLPYRTKHSLRRFCHRRFHNLSVRGAWTVEDDELLDQAVAEKGKSWVAVGQMMGRLDEDVRDRWRNYHVNAESRNKEHWTDVEVRNLVRAVDECMQMMRQARRRAWEEKFEGRDLPESGPDMDDSKLINWQVVSDIMKGSRSRLQCSFKWAQLRDADRRRFMKEVRAAQNEQDVMAAQKKPKKKPWRKMKALKRVEQMRPGDKQGLLEALSGCGADDEDSIPWQSLGGPEFKAQWTTADKQVAWHVMKESFPGAERMDYMDVVNRLMTKHMAEHENLEEKYNPAIHGYGKMRPLTKAEKAEHKKKKYKERLERQKQRREVKNAGKLYKAPQIKSEVFVQDSDEEGIGQPTMDMEDPHSTTHSNDDSRRSSDGLETQGHCEQGKAAETADTSIDGFDDEEIPRSRQASDDLLESLQSLRHA